MKYFPKNKTSRSIKKHFCVTFDSFHGITRVVTLLAKNKTNAKEMIKESYHVERFIEIKEL